MTMERDKDLFSLKDTVDLEFSILVQSYSVGLSPSIDKVMCFANNAG